jgi:hypothetical protein
MLQLVERLVIFGKLLNNNIMKMNFLVIAAAALIPMVVGFIWYNPMIFGRAWMEASGMTEEKAKSMNMPLILALSFVLSFMLAIPINFMTIHQFSLGSLVMGPELQDPNSETSLWLKDAMAKYGHNYRTFKHGVFHGLVGGLFFVLPILGTGALFERKSFKYVAINVGYWMLTIALMGGVICAYA